MSNKPVGFRRLLHWSLRLLFPLALSAALCVGAVAQQEATITISRIAGAVEVQHDFATAGEWVLASTGQELASGWKLRTGSGAKAQLVFPQENVVILKENSVLFVDSLDLGGGATLKADEGSLLVDIRNALAAGSEFELVTPTALAVVRGTKYAAVEIDGYDVTFYGYDGAVEIMNDMGEGAVWLVADKAVDVIYGEIPSEPYDSPLDAEAFLADAEDTSGFDEAEGTAQAYVDQLGSLEVELLGYHEVLTEYQQEWRRYERRDQVTHMVVLYAQVLAVQAQVDDAAERFAALQGEIPEEIVGIAPLPEMLQHIAELFAQLYAMLEEFADDAEPIITDNEEILDMLNGLIGPGDPTLGLRWGLFDTDNDGISDIDEIALGLDPWAANDNGFIELIAPEDDDQVDYPEETELTFEFEMLDTDLVEEYQLVFEIGGQRWARRDVDDSEDVDLTPLVGENGVFQAALDDEGALALQWYVVALIEEDQLFAQIAQQQPGFQGAFDAAVMSERRDLVIQTPVQEDVVVVDLEPVGPTMVGPEDTVRVRGLMSEVNALGAWEIKVFYDPSVLEFDTGRRLGLFATSTVFFGDQAGGWVVISGSAPRTVEGLSGEDDIFELEFIALEPGDSVIEVEEASLTDTLGREIEAEGGDEVEIEVSPNLGSALDDYPDYQTPGTYR